MRLVASGVVSSSLYFSDSFSLLGATRSGSVGILPFHSMSVLLHLGSPTALGGLGAEYLQLSLDVLGKLCLYSSHISSPSYVQVSGSTCHRSVQPFDSRGIMFDEGSLASHSSQHIGRCSSALSCDIRSHCGCFGRPGAQESGISAFNPLAAQEYVLCRQGFSSLASHTVEGAT